MTMENEVAARNRVVAATFAEAARLHECMRNLDPTPILAAVDAIDAAITAGGKVLVFGNGGSAADAQHFAAEFVGRFGRERRALAAVALTADASVLTAVSNETMASSTYSPGRSKLSAVAKTSSSVFQPAAARPMWHMPSPRRVRWASTPSHSLVVAEVWSPRRRASLSSFLATRHRGFRNSTVRYSTSSAI